MKTDEMFEYKGSNFKRYVLRHAVLWAEPVPEALISEHPEAAGHVRLGWRDEQGRRCTYYIDEGAFDVLFEEASNED